MTKEGQSENRPTEAWTVTAITINNKENESPKNYRLQTSQLNSLGASIKNNATVATTRFASTTEISTSHRQAIVDELTRIMNGTYLIFFLIDYTINKNLESQHEIGDWKQKSETKSTRKDIGKVESNSTSPMKKKHKDWEKVHSKLFDEQQSIADWQAAKDQRMQKLLTPARPLTSTLNQQKTCNEAAKPSSSNSQKAQSNKGKPPHRNDTPLLRKSQTKNTSNPCPVHLACIEEEHQTAKPLSPLRQDDDPVIETQKSVEDDLDSNELKLEENKMAESKAAISTSSKKKGLIIPM
ncbi:hypothetical protein RFI_14557 [Reticulomyxa filosa]|uniref:Uncharacterized protein n=1 Tax=Reticulomyxa filosa TaxID=46433 RepID=X6N9P2_RETFI|nr:hypothetical protein RFI_14557 [Reticulomyxa filosa]|eukprot:ETO22638.1 hypothetical protein RFI_14557 [Reticulomyxa filosa]